MNRTQIAKIYDEFPEGQRDMPREEFIRKTLRALDPTSMTAEADAMVQQRITGRMSRATIDAALKES